jgi:ATP-dependent Clp protease ATP-binding subunit ClpC
MQRTVSRSGELARAMGHDYLGTEHVILALIEDSDGIAGVVLHRLNCATAVRNEVLRIIESDSYSRRSPDPTDSAPGG